MPETQIYKLDLTTADFSYGWSPAYWSSAWGGTDTPNADYPEFAQMENVRRNENAGTGGQHVIDQFREPNDYTISWVTLIGLGPLTYGQYDCRGGGAGLKVRWKQFLSTAAWAEVEYSSALCLTHGGKDGANIGAGWGLFSNARFFHLDMYEDGGQPRWEAGYRTFSGTDPSATSVLTWVDGSIIAFDDEEHEIIVTIVPSTVTGQYASAPNSGRLGSAVVASDGSFDVALDGTSILSASGLRFAINQFADANPDVYYGKGIWHGD